FPLNFSTLSKQAFPLSTSTHSTIHFSLHPHLTSIVRSFHRHLFSIYLTLPSPLLSGLFLPFSLAFSLLFFFFALRARVCSLSVTLALCITPLSPRSRLPVGLMRGFSSC